MKITSVKSIDDKDEVCITFDLGYQDGKGTVLEFLFLPTEKYTLLREYFSNRDGCHLGKFRRLLNRCFLMKIFN